ncbi:MAG: radical SAM family heme chaperone HemW [Bacteroidales bacterium]|nr:radical SAM family heme chaperone HemW [Bacteroidales bacterium]
MKEKKQYINNLFRELIERKNYLNGQTIQTIYFGGGTPSLLEASDFEGIFTCIRNLPEVDWENAEITLEANPDDISNGYLKSIGHLPFNRISLGVQSFSDKELKFLNRRHNAQTAIQAVETLQNYGYNNISIDLMYGLPQQSAEGWKKNIRQAMDLDIQHISAYHLIYEEGTRLHRLLMEGDVNPVDEELSSQMFEILIETLESAGFKQYEISNFAKPGFHSRHNSSYWDGSHYLGIGAAAHSYNGVSRQWNKNILKGNYLDYTPETEIIDGKAAYNDFVITRLRTMKGINLEDPHILGKKQYMLQQAEKYLKNHLLEVNGNYLRLTRKGIFVSDGIMSDLME